MADTPIGYTSHFNIAKFAEGDYPGADALNNNWDIIDSALNNAGTAGNFVTIDTSQVLTAGKTFNSNNIFNGQIIFGDNGVFYPPMNPINFGVTAVKVEVDPEDPDKWVMVFGADTDTEGIFPSGVLEETIATREWINNGSIGDLLVTGYRVESEIETPGLWINFQDEDQIGRIKISDFAEVSPSLKPLYLQSSNFAVNYDSELGLTDFNFNNFVIIDDAGDVEFNSGDFTLGATNKRIIYNYSKSLFLPALGTRVAVLNLALGTTCKVFMTSSENGHFQEFDLNIWRRTYSGVGAVITKNALFTHLHSNDVGFSTDIDGNVYLEKLAYTTWRNVKISRIEIFSGDVTVLDGSLTDTGVGADQSLIAHNVWGVNGSNIYYTSGAVGIGTTNPQSDLDVKGEALFGDADRTQQSTFPLYISDGSNLGFKVCDATGTAKFELYVGYGGTNELKLLNGVSVVAVAQDLLLRSTNGDVILNPTQGRVGIRTTDPYDTLHVNGSMVISDGYEFYNRDFHAGWSQAGFMIDYNNTKANLSTATFDDLWIRGTLHAYELLIHQIRAVEGGQVISPGSGKVESVAGSVYTMEDPEEDGVTSFAVNDIVLVQQVSLDGSTLTRRIVRKVTAVSGNDVTFGTLSGAPADTGTIREGDVVVTIGNTTDTDRQGSIFITASDSGAPYIQVKDGVNSWTAWTSNSTTKARLGNLSGYTFGGSALSGYGLVSENCYLSGEFDISSTQTILDMQGEIQDLDDQVTINTAGISANASGISLNAGEITTVKGRVTTAEASIVINADGISSNVSSISSLDGRVTTAESNITQNADNINLKVSKNDVINQINISTEGILIAGDNIEINGSTTFSTGYDPSTKITGAEVDENITTIDGGMIQTNTVTANAINVSQLSAISADLGTITAGTITGATIKTSGGNERVEITNGDDINWFSGGSHSFRMNTGSDFWYLYSVTNTDNILTYQTSLRKMFFIGNDFNMGSNLNITGNLSFDGGTNVDEIQTSVDTDTSALVTSSGIKTYVDNAVADVPTKYILYSDVSLASTAVNAGATVQEYYQTSSTQQLKIYIPYVHDSKTQTIRVTSQLRVVTGGNTIYMRAKVGAGSEQSASTTATSPSTVSVDIDVSGLSDGTLTAIYIYMDSASTGHAGYMKNVVVQAIA